MSLVLIMSLKTFFFLYIEIGNVLLLRNNLTLSPDTGEISQEKLLSLVAERLIDSNSNVNVIIAILIDLKVFSGFT